MRTIFRRLDFAVVFRSIYYYIHVQSLSEVSCIRKNLYVTTPCYSRCNRSIWPATTRKNVWL